MAAKEYAVIKDGTIVKTYKSLSGARALADKEGAEVFSGGKCVYKAAPDLSPVAAEEEVEETDKGTAKTTTYTLTHRMNVRKEPSLKAEIIGNFLAGTKVEVTDIKDDWLCLADGSYILYKGGQFAKKTDDAEKDSNA